MRFAFVGVAALGAFMLSACAESNVGEPAFTAGPASSAALSDQPMPDWSPQLDMLLPALEACLAAVRGAVGVTKAWTVESRFAGARVVTATKERFDCIASKDGAMVLLTEPVPAKSQMPGELEPLFTPAAAPPPRSSCYETRDAIDASGARIGWLSYETCRHPKRLSPSAQSPRPRQQGDS